MYSDFSLSSRAENLSFTHSFHYSPFHTLLESCLYPWLPKLSGNICDNVEVFSFALRLPLRCGCVGGAPGLTRMYLKQCIPNSVSSDFWCLAQKSFNRATWKLQYGSVHNWTIRSAWKLAWFEFADLWIEIPVGNNPERLLTSSP